MSFFQAIILGLIQGLTEFIPVSSSGHLVLLHEVFAIQGGLVFDVALHIGTLLALTVFFWRDIVLLVQGVAGKTEQRHLARLIVLATIPAVILGIVLQGAAESTFRSTTLVSFNLIAVALLMLLAESLANKIKHPTTLEKISTKQAGLIGIAQALAIIPGISRSGATITAGLFVGVDRVAATRFSFLLAIPITAGAILKVVLQEDSLQLIGNDGGVFLAGIISAFLSGMFAIRFLLRYLAKHSLRVFAYYRIVLGLLVLLATL